MILPIRAYGDPVLRQEAEPIEADSPALQTLIDNMFETMYNASGVGLAAPQIGESIRLFVVDGEPMYTEDSDEPALQTFKRVFINPEYVDESGEPWSFDEGCLSIPDLREPVKRAEALTLNYLDRNWQEHTETFTGLRARIVQHEYDHLEGILFTDYASPMRKRILRPRLQKIARGTTEVNYPMQFPNARKARTRSNA